MKRIFLMAALMSTLAACGCGLFGSNPDNTDKPEPVVKDQPQPEKPVEQIKIDKPEIPQPDEATAKKIAEALKTYTDENAKPGERQDALLKDLAALGTVAYADILRLFSGTETWRSTYEIVKYFSDQPADARDKALVVQLFNDDKAVRAGAWEVLAMFHPQIKPADYKPDADEQTRYKAILKIKETLGIQE